jgi:phage terminase large subunit-like protein
MCGDTPLTGGRWRHIAIIAETAADARDVMVGDGKEPSNPSAGSGASSRPSRIAAIAAISGCRMKPPHRRIRPLNLRRP